MSRLFFRFGLRILRLQCFRLVYTRYFCCPYSMKVLSRANCIKSRQISRKFGKLAISCRVIAVKSHRFTRAKLKKTQMQLESGLWAFYQLFSSLLVLRRFIYWVGLWISSLIFTKRSWSCKSILIFWKLLELQFKRIVFLFIGGLPSKEDDIIRFHSGASKADYAGYWFQNINQTFSFTILFVNCRNLHSCHPSSGESSCTTFV